MMKMSTSKYPVLILGFILSVADAKYNTPLLMPSSRCGNNNAKEIDGATVSSTTNSLYENSACVLKFKADDGYTSKRIMANLTDVRIKDCTKKLSVYFSSNTYGTPDVTLDCRSSNRGVVKSTSKYLTLRLDGSLRYPDTFKIILTSVKTTSYCSEFKCDNGNCIDDDLECDGIDHCFDGSDEKLSPSTGLCYAVNDHVDVEGAVKLGMGIIFAIVIGVIVICVLGCVLLICCCYRRRRSKGTVIRGPPVSQTTTTTNVPMQQPQQAGYQAGYVPPPAQPYPPAPGPPGVAYPPPAHPGAAYPPPAHPGAGYPPPPQPGGYPQQPAAYPQYPTGPVAPPAYHDKPYSDSPPYPQTQQVQYTASPADVKMPSAPPNC